MVYKGIQLIIRTVYCGMARINARGIFSTLKAMGHIKNRQGRNPTRADPRRN